MFLLMGAFVAALPAQSPTSANELRSKYLAALAHQGEEEIRAFRRRGGNPSSTQHPGRKWAARFWGYRAAHPGTAAAAQAVSEALWMWLAAEQWPAMRDAVETLSHEDAAWNESFRPLLLASDTQKDYAWFERKLAGLTNACGEPQVCASAWTFTGYALARQQKHAEAREAAARAMRLAPPGQRAKAEAAYDEITRLSAGLPAPAFTTTSLEGRPVSLAQFRGKVVLLNFWASW